MLISVIILEKNQRLEAVRAVCGIDQWDVGTRQTIPTQPVHDESGWPPVLRSGVWARIVNRAVMNISDWNSQIWEFHLITRIYFIELHRNSDETKQPRP